VKQGKKKKKIFWLVIGAVALMIASWIFLRGGNQSEEEIPLFAVRKGPLTISVTSGGSIQSRDKVIIQSELEGNNTVIWVIDEGTNVQAGDLLLEFDANDLLDKRKEQEVVVANAEAAVIFSEEKLSITEGDCEAAMLDRETDKMLAKMAQDKYQKGDYPQTVRQHESDIALAEEDVNRAAETLEWSQKLAEQGFLTRTELQADELALKRKQIALEMAQTKMDVLTNYTVVQENAKLSTSLRRADRALTRTAFQNKASLRQVETELRARRRERDRATNRLAELNFQIEKSKIYAPTNGIVLYASTEQIAHRRWWIKPLAVGSTATWRSELIHIPLESGMIVEVMIPEASLNKIFQGMPAKVKIDAFPGEVFDGHLVKIAILPDGQSSQLNPDLKLYKCEIECDFKNTVIRPGMSCDVELIKESFDSALYVPVQCVVRIDGKPRVYVKEGGGFQPRDVEVGLDNNRMIRILNGLKEGETVMLAPPVKETKAQEEDEASKDREKIEPSPDPSAQPPEKGRPGRRRMRNAVRDKSGEGKPVENAANAASEK